MENIEQILEYLSYDKESGNFTWIKSPVSHVHEGSNAGFYAKNGYVHIGFGGRLYRAHRLAWFLVYGDWPKKHLDHIDRNKHNNAISNLRECTDSQNGQNCRKAKGKTSRYVGVSYDKHRDSWQAYITIHRKRKVLGRFKTEELAAEAYREAKEKLHTFHGEPSWSHE